MEHALEIFTGVSSPVNNSCKIYAFLVKMFLKTGGTIFGVGESQLKDYFMDPITRRGLLNVLQGIARYGITRPQRLAAPFLVVWNYTNACNLKCRHCYQSAEKPAPDELLTEERLEIIDQLDKAGVASIAFSGGEPLMRGDFFEVAEYAADKGMYVSIATNGTLLTERVVEKLKNIGVKYVEISLDGARRETHEAFRGVRGCFDKTLRGIRNSVEGGLFTCIATVATKHNLHEIPDIIKLGKSLRVQRVLIFNFIPTGRGENIVSLDLSPTEREQLLKYLYDELVKGEIEVMSTAPQYARVCLQHSLISKSGMLSPTHFAAVEFHGQTKQLADFIGGCGAGRMYCAIQPNGLVTPCVFMPIIAGDLRRQSFQEMWLHSRVMNDLRDREKLEGRCGNCPYKYVCGGCRARAYAYYHNYLAPDPGCIRELEEPSTPSTQELEMSMHKIP